MVTPTRATVTVFSPAMRKPISVTVLLPADRTRPVPTLYLLDGIDAGVYTRYTESGWTTQTDVVRFMADKPVNVVLPIGGTASYYTDWNATDPVLGRNKWETFLTTELPPLIDQRFGGNGVNALGGLSMGALGAMAIDRSASSFPVRRRRSVQRVPGSGESGDAASHCGYRADARRQSGQHVG